MANNTEAVFDNIEQRILNEIGDAHYAIFVSVAWFTNKKLFSALLEKAKNNCYVSIIIQLDEINAQCGIDYSQIQIGRSECFKISKDAELLHDKFCVIDFKKVITGSYNWTYKASQNSENILILNDPSVATQYISRFEQQKAKFQDSSTNEKSVPPLSNEPTTIVQTTSVHIINQCPHCKIHAKIDSPFCPWCGKQITVGCEQPLELIREVKCNHCSRIQEESFIDATRTKYCTFCGSNNLKWSFISVKERT